MSATQAMQLHSCPLQAEAAIEELIRELLGEWPFLTCQPLIWKVSLVGASLHEAQVILIIPGVLRVGLRVL